MAAVDAKPGPHAAVAEFAPLLRAASEAHAVDPYLLAAVALEESKGNPYAIRVERAFWARYKTGIVRAVLGDHWAGDDPWVAFPDLVAASYGLCQVMYVVAVERGVRLTFPTELCDPRLNLHLAAGELARHLRAVKGDTSSALLLYNGGRDPTYPARVLAGRRALLEDAEFPRLEYVVVKPPGA